MVFAPKLDNGITIKPFAGGQGSMREVADFYLDVQRGVEAAGQKIFEDIEETWQELRQLDRVYVGPGNFWVAYTPTGRLVGCIGLKDEGRGRGYVGRFGVDSTLRRQGIGSRLIATLISWAQENNFRELTLETNEKQHGMPIYKRLGFVVVGTASDGDHIMRLEL